MPVCTGVSLMRTPKPFLITGSFLLLVAMASTLVAMACNLLASLHQSVPLF